MIAQWMMASIIGTMMFVGSARADDVEPPVHLWPEGRVAFRKYIEAPNHKAFAVGFTKAYAYRTRAATTDIAIEQAMSACNRISKVPCRVVMIDNDPAP